MFSQNFIFSGKKSDRIKRHLLYWFCYWFYFTFLHAAHPGGKPEIQYFRNIPFATLEAFLLTIPQILFTYSLISFILPKYLLKGRYFLSVLLLIVFVIATAFINYCILIYVEPIVMETVLPEKFFVRDPRMNVNNFYLAITISFKGTLVAAAGACSIKLVKYWHLKEKRNLELLKEKTEAQLQLLTAQVHPHFLFNTLNNIYSQTQNESPKGSKMIMALSDLLRYILSEGNKATVPLNKELTMLNDYINLEKVRYGNKLDLHISMPQETGCLQITPLLLLPFVENCFKHGTSKFLIHPWINLKVELKEKTMIMKLMNGKDTHQMEALVKSGTGIMNVKKRLELLYKDKYELQITDEPEVFVVNLKLELTEGKHESKTISESIPTLDYA